jgi:acyl-CoA dehydrogenase
MTVVAALTPAIDAGGLLDRTCAFVRTACIPREAEVRLSHRAVTDALIGQLVAEARAAGVYGPHLPKSLGGHDLPWVDRARVFQAAGYSLLGPSALHCAAPDEGNQHLLHAVANAEQKAEYLEPMVREAARTCFMMSEPDGAGADPMQLKTVAVRDGSDYLISGRKWYITGAIGARFTIILARDEAAGGATMFLAPMTTPGITIVRDMGGGSHESPGGHCEIALDNVRVPKSAVLGEAGQAFRYAQLRLAPARLTHCMRWLGAAERAHDVARHHAARRTSFGKPLGGHQLVGAMLADNEIEMKACELMITDCAKLLDAGEKARHETSVAKVFVSEAVGRIVDRCVQVMGGLGVMADSPVETIWHAARAFRIYDGPSETHRDAIARQIMKRSAQDLAIGSAKL